MILHGVLGTYVHQHCRCDDCAAAARAYHQAYRARKRAEGLPPGDRRHGTRYGYKTFGCRCEPCTTAGREWNARAHRERKLRLRFGIS